MIIGYARVSTEDQRLDLQLRALNVARCEHIFSDRGQSGAQFERDGLNAALAQLQAGDTLVVWRLDRLGRSLSALVNLIDQLGRRNVAFRSLTENIDTGSSGGRLMLHIMAALAEFERSVVSERTRAGLAAVRARGKQVGRPRLLDWKRLLGAIDAIIYQRRHLDDVAQEFRVSPRTLRRYLAASKCVPCRPEPGCGRHTSLSCKAVRNFVASAAPDNRRTTPTEPPARSPDPV